MGYRFRREFSLTEVAARGTCGHLVPGGRDQHGFVAEHHGCSNTSPTRRVALVMGDDDLDLLHAGLCRGDDHRRRRVYRVRLRG